MHQEKAFNFEQIASSVADTVLTIEAPQGE